MNETDLKILTDAWSKETTAIENAVQEAIKRSQDHAYELGIERGKLNLNKTLLVIEQTIKALDDEIAGNGTRQQQVEGIEAAYEQLEALHKELSC